MKDAPSIDGGDVTPLFGSTFVITGTAPANSLVTLHFRRAGMPLGTFPIVRTVTANSAGVWARAIVADVDYRYYATVGSLQSKQVLNQPQPTVDGSTTRLVALNRHVTVAGKSVPGSKVFVHLHKAGTPSNDYSIIRGVATSSDGSWSGRFLADSDYRFFVSDNAENVPASGVTNLIVAR